MIDDPFGDDDRTVLYPGGANPASTTRASQSAATSPPPPQLSGINPLEQAASRLLNLAVSIRYCSTHPNPQLLRDRLIEEVNAFKQDAQRILNNQAQATQASYILCTTLDEAAMHTPWGHQNNWSQHSLLSTFHNEVIGGDRFFILLKKLGKTPRENIELLELMYVCLSLGYEGAYRIAHNGKDTLLRVRQWLYEIITNVRAQPDSELSPQWQGSAIQESSLPRWTLLWFIAPAMLALTSVAYTSYRFSLGARSEQAISSFYTAQVEDLQVNFIPPPLAPQFIASNNSASKPTLTQHLQAQIDRGLVEIQDSFNEGKIRLLGTNLFSSGRAEIDPEFKPLLDTIARALNDFEGTIVVTGHSDNIPIRSGRFASNLELSQARAESVARYLQEILDSANRVNAQGRGSLEPLADNTTAEGRARNRRVEISIFY